MTHVTEETADSEGRTPRDADRWDLYFSGGGYRAAIAAVGALYVIAGIDRWSSVRNITSVSGGGILNAWLATHKPKNDADVMRLLSDTLSWLTDRRRSTANVLAAVGVAALLVVPAATLIWWVIATQHAWLAVLTTVVVIAVAAPLALWAALRVFVFREFREFDDKLRSFDDADWYRSHTFVASDLLASRSVFVVVNRALQWVVAPRSRHILEAGGLRLSEVVRASAAFPPALPPVRFNLPKLREADSSAEVVQQVGLWVVDGGATGNLGVQYGGGKGLEAQMGPLWGARFEIAMAEDSIRITAKQLEDIRELIAEATDRSNRVLDDISRRIAEAKKARPDLRLQFKQRLAEENIPLKTVDDFQEYAARALKIGHEVYADASTESARPELEREKLRTPKEFEPECGHDDRPSWAACNECKTRPIVVDASGPAPTPRAWERWALRVPGIASLITAGRTLRIEYEENLLSDRAREGQILVSVIRSDKTYESSVSHLNVADDFLTTVRWHLSDTLLAGELRGALQPIDYLRTRLADRASAMRTGLVAPRRSVADEVLASGVVNAYASLDATPTLSGLLQVIARLPPDAKDRVLSAVEVTSQGFDTDKTHAQSWIADWVRRLKPLRDRHAAALARRDSLRSDRNQHQQDD